MLMTPVLYHFFLFVQCYDIDICKSWLIYRNKHIMIVFFVTETHITIVYPFCGF
uniref:Uncharacterized protein n=1 Tax=Arundo donax TaxID=35708 RepID=A0A0A8ZHQ7_ARUDO